MQIVMGVETNLYVFIQQSIHLLENGTEVVEMHCPKSIYNGKRIGLYLIGFCNQFSPFFHGIAGCIHGLHKNMITFIYGSRTELKCFLAFMLGKRYSQTLKRFVVT